ncbi:MAG: hypothetical protein K0U74_00765 [Alphaproteobacteria bacterium]|nr:hypothetical protein [Alphaproteobacteria bacterium]
MIEILVSACLIASPGTCKDVSLSYMADKVTPYNCMMRGQVALTKWAAGHPKWKIAKWKCSASREMARLRHR